MEFEEKYFEKYLPEIFRKSLYIYVMDFDGLIQETSCRFSHKSHVLARWTHPGIDRGLPPQKWADLKMALPQKLRAYKLVYNSNNYGFCWWYIYSYWGL